jgi:hypothetical protein
MAKLTLSEAARACNVARTTIQRAVKTGRVSVDAEHRVDTAELLRVGYHLDAAVLHAASQQFAADVQQDAAPQRSTTQQQDVAAQELQLLRQERDALQRERDLLMQQVTMLHTMHQTTQQQLTQAQQMLHEMQHRYDHLLDMPRPVVPPESPQDAPGGTQGRGGQDTPRPSDRPRAPRVPRGEAPRGTMRRRIVALLQEHQAGLSAEEIRVYLRPDRPLGDVLQGMRRQHVVTTRGHGKETRYYLP